MYQVLPVSRCNNSHKDGVSKPRYLFNGEVFQFRTHKLQKITSISFTKCFICSWFVLQLHIVKRFLVVIQNHNLLRMHHLRHCHIVYQYNQQVSSYSHSYSASQSISFSRSVSIQLVTHKLYHNLHHKNRIQTGNSMGTRVSLELEFSWWE